MKTRAILIALRPLVPLCNVLNMTVEEFRKHGVPFQFHQIAGAEHGLSGGDRAEIEEAQRKAFAFVKLHLAHP